MSITGTSPIKIAKTPISRISEIDFNDLSYGKIYSDHMLIADYRNGSWNSPTIMPFGPIEMSPTISALHYGQSIFEGLKAFRNEKGETRLFRHMDNFRRMNESARRMGMPEVPEYFFREGLTSLVNLDKAWTPALPGSALYIRPVLFATDEKIGVHISDSYKFVIFTTPVGVYYSKPLKALVESEYTRAAPGGVGAAKAAGNYGASMFPSKLAKEKGYDQIIWTDAIEHRYLEEAGTMNIMVVINDTLITPPLNNTTLAGITRDSVLTMARDWEIKVEERPISIEEVIQALNDGSLREIFGVGTAATVTHIELIGYDGRDYKLPPINNELLSEKLQTRLSNIRLGLEPDIFGWNTII